METAIKKYEKWVKFAILAVVVALTSFYISQRPSGIQLDEAEGLVLGELPPKTDGGVASPGFEEIVKLGGKNVKAVASMYEKIDGVYSLMLDFSDQRAAAKVEKYIDGASKENFYRLGFWAKADRDKEIILSVAKDDDQQELGRFSLPGDHETRYYEAVFQAQINPEDMVVSSSDSRAARVWLDDFFLDRLETQSAEETGRLKQTVAGVTTWENPDLSDEFRPGGNNMGDFLSRPGRLAGIIFQPKQDFISGAVLKIQKVGHGGDGKYQLQIRPVDEHLGGPSNTILAASIIDHDYSPEIQDEIKLREQQMKEEFARKEKLIADGKLVDETEPDGVKYPDNYTLDQIKEAQADRRASQLETAILEMKEGYNQPKEMVIPLSAKLNTDRKYWIGLSNEGVVVDQDNYLVLFENEDEGPKAVTSQDSANIWKEEPGNGIWVKLFSPNHTFRDGQQVASGSVVSDLGAGQGRFRYALKSTDGYCYSGIHGRMISDLAEGEYTKVNLLGLKTISREAIAEDAYVVYRFPTFYPIEKIILRHIGYMESLRMELSYDGQDWREIYSGEVADASVPGKVDHLVLKGDGSSREFYLRLSPERTNMALTNLEVEALLKME